MILHIHKDTTDSLSLLDICNEFVNNENRERVVGQFTKNDQ